MDFDEEKKKQGVRRSGICTYLEWGRIHHDEGAMNCHHTESGGETTLRQKLENTSTAKNNSY